MQAIPRSWLKPGSTLGVDRVGSHFGGQVGLKVEIAKDGNAVEVAAHLDLAVMPKETRVRLRSGDGRPLTSATVNGASTAVLEKDTILLPAQTKGDLRIVGKFPV